MQMKPSRINPEVKQKPAPDDTVERVKAVFSRELERPLFHHEVYDRRSAYISLVALAGAHDCNVHGSLEDLAYLWGWHTNRVLGFLDQLSASGLIEFQVSSGWSLIITLTPKEAVP